jgi:hypothetical protein
VQDAPGEESNCRKNVIYHHIKHYTAIIYNSKVPRDEFGIYTPWPLGRYLRIHGLKSPYINMELTLARGGAVAPLLLVPVIAAIKPLRIPTQRDR